MLEPVVKQEHINLANQFAQEVISRFNPVEANEIIEQVMLLIIEDRKQEIAKTSEKLEFLRKSLEEIQLK